MAKKTILVVFNYDKLDATQLRQAKKYSFNTESDLREGDILKSPEYDTRMHVVKVLDKAYSYFNKTTGELSDEFTSSAQWTLRDLELREEKKDVAYCTLVERTAIDIQ